MKKEVTSQGAKIFPARKGWLSIDSPVIDNPVATVSAGKVDRTGALLTVGEVAGILQIHCNTVRRWSNLGILPSFRIGPRGDRRFRKEDVANFLSKCIKKSM